MEMPADLLNVYSLFVGALAFFGVYGLVVFVSKRHKRGSSSGDANTDLGLSPLQAIAVTVFIYFAGFLGPQISAGVFLGSYVAGRGLTDAESTALLETALIQAVFSALFYGVMALFIVWFLRLRKLNLRSIGIVKPRPRDLGYALVAIGLYLLVATIVTSIISKFIPGLNLDQRQELGFSGIDTPPELLLVFVSLVILPPLVEELMTRGLLFTGLRQKLRLRWAILITSVVFAIPHLQFGSDAPPLWSAAIDTFILSLFLCYLRDRTGSLWPSIFMHAIKNCIAFLALFVFHVSV